MKDRDTLTPKQERFVAELCVDLNATQAAIRAGYSARSAKVTASRMLTNANVQAAVAEKQATHLKKIDDSVEAVLLENAWIAHSNVKDLVDEHGCLLPIKDMPPHAAAAIKSIEVTKRNLSAGDGVQEDVVRIQFWDKGKAIELNFKRHGLLVEKVELSADAEIIRRLDAARHRELNPPPPPKLIGSGTTEKVKRARSVKRPKRRRRARRPKRTDAEKVFGL